jgi:dihydrofolate reductase
MIKIIAAVSQDGVIGKKSTNSIPWNYPEDMKHFRESTKDSIVIMGKQTFLSMGRPLPKRINIVISSTLENVEGVHIVDSMGKAITLAKTFDKEIWIIGGSSIYKEGMNLADEIVLTLIPERVSKDNDKEDLVLFPQINKSLFKNKSMKKIGENLSVITFSK